MKIYHAQPLDPTLSVIIKDKDYQFVSIADCDFILYHQLYNNVKEVKKFISRLSKEYQHVLKKVVLFLMLDDERDYGHYDNIIIVRASAKAGRLRYNEIILPYVWESSESPYPISEITEKPTVGFCGLLSKHRKKLVQTFNQSSQVASNFLVRDKFWGGQPHDKNLVSDFSNNIKDTQFTLSNRGAGNFSMRFYQVISSGRIPVLVNTDMALPFSNNIPWGDILVFEKSEASCLKRVIEINKAGKTQQMQKALTKVYNEYLHPDVYFSQLINEINSRSLLNFDFNPKVKFSLLQKIKDFISR